MIYNLNARRLSDGTIFVQYNEEGKACDGSFPSWKEFNEWLRNKIDKEPKPAL